MRACKADCTVAALAGSFHPVTGGSGEVESSEGTEEGRRAALTPPSPPPPTAPPPLSLSFFLWTVQSSFPVTAVLLSRGGGSSTGREAAWDRWTCPAPPPTTASLIKNRSAAAIDVLSGVGATEPGVCAVGVPGGGTFSATRDGEVQRCFVKPSLSFWFF